VQKWLFFVIITQFSDSHTLSFTPDGHANLTAMRQRVFCIHCISRDAKTQIHFNTT